MLRFCDSSVVASAPWADNLEQLRAFFPGHLLWCGRGNRIREVWRSLRGSIDGSARVLFNSLTRSEQAASGNSKRASYGEYRGKSFHSAESLRRKRVLASESSPARGEFAVLAITVTAFFRNRHLVVTAPCNVDVFTE